MALQVEGEPQQAVLLAWIESPEIIRLGTTGVMANVTTKKELSRPDVCRNVTVLCPVVEHLGA